MPILYDTKLQYNNVKCVYVFVNKIHSLLMSTLKKITVKSINYNLTVLFFHSAFVPYQCLSLGLFSIKLKNMRNLLKINWKSSGYQYNSKDQQIEIWG